MSFDHLRVHAYIHHHHQSPQGIQALAHRRGTHMGCAKVRHQAVRKTYLTLCENIVYTPVVLVHAHVVKSAQKPTVFNTAQRRRRVDMYGRVWRASCACSIIPMRVLIYIYAPRACTWWRNSFSGKLSSFESDADICYDEANVSRSLYNSRQAGSNDATSSRSAGINDPGPRTDGRAAARSAAIV